MLPSERHTFQTSRGNTYSFIHVPARAAQPTILLLHGFPSHAADWAAQTAHLAALGFGVLAPDLLGFGRSSAPAAASAYALRGLSDDLAELLRRARVPAVVGVAHDLGANLLSRAAAYHPALFRGLLFLAVGAGPPARRLDVPAVQRATGGMFGYLAWLGGAEDPHALLERRAEAAMSLMFAAGGARAWREWLHPPGAMERFVAEDRRVPVGAWYGAPMRAAHLEVFAARGGYRGATRWYRMLVTNASLAEEEEALAGARLRQPTVIVADAQSMPMQKAMLAEWVSDLTAREVDSGHWVHLECADQVNQIITEFAESL